MTITEIAIALHVHPRTVAREIRRGRLPAFRIGRALRVLPAALDSYRGGPRAEAA